MPVTVTSNRASNCTSFPRVSPPASECTSAVCMFTTSCACDTAFREFLEASRAKRDLHRRIISRKHRSLAHTIFSFSTFPTGAILWLQFQSIDTYSSKSEFTFWLACCPHFHLHTHPLHLVQSFESCPLSQLLLYVVIQARVLQVIIFSFSWNESFSSVLITQYSFDSWL